MRSCPLRNRTGYRRPSSSNTVLASSPPSRSRSASTSGHTSANGSGRVGQLWLAFSSPRSFPALRYLRAVGSLMPAFTAAVDNTNPFLISNISRLTCWFVVIGSPPLEESVPDPTTRPEPENSNCRHPKVLIVAEHSVGEWGNFTYHKWGLLTYR